MEWAIYCLVILFWNQGEAVTPVADFSKFSLDETLTKATKLYFDEDYKPAIKLFEKSIINHKIVKDAQLACSKKCEKSSISKELNLDFDGHRSLEVFGNIIAEANCFKICLEEHPYRVSKTPISEQHVSDDMEYRKQYDYLQFAYFKTNKIKKACQAAQTYLQRNPDDADMIKNVDYYKTLPNVEESWFKDLEAPPYYEPFLLGIQAYEAGESGDVIQHIETTLLQYFQSHKECQLMCNNKPLYQMETFYRFHKAVADQYLSYIDCALGCEARLQPVVYGAAIPNFVAYCQSYLQFSYHAIGNWNMAVKSAASVLLMNPDDETAAGNMQYYRNNAQGRGVTDADYLPRNDVKKYKENRDKLKLLKEKAVAAWGGEESEVIENPINKKRGEDVSMRDLAKTITEELKLQINEMMKP